VVFFDQRKAKKGKELADYSIVVLIDVGTFFKAITNLFDVGQLYHLKVFAGILDLELSSLLLGLCQFFFYPYNLLGTTFLQLLCVILHHFMETHYLVADSLLDILLIVSKIVLEVRLWLLGAFGFITALHCLLEGIMSYNDY
jgi:hypothetical protein